MSGRSMNSEVCMKSTNVRLSSALRLGSSVIQLTLRREKNNRHESAKHADPLQCSNRFMQDKRAEDDHNYRIKSAEGTYDTSLASALHSRKQSQTAERAQQP